MKKTILSLAAAVIAFSSFSSYARTPERKASCQSTDSTCCVAMRGDRQRPAFNPFEGITLSAEQQTQLQALQADCKAKAESAKADRKDKARKAKSDRQANRKAQLERIKAILTPEQYVTYLENIATGERRFAPGHRKDGRKGARANSANRRNKADRRGRCAACPAAAPAQDARS